MAYDIVFFTDNATRFGHVKPLGAYRLASELRSHGYTVKVVDFTCKLITDKKLFKTLLDTLIGENTLFVGWSSSFFGDYSLFDRKDHTLGIRTYNDMSFKYPTTEKDFSLWLKYIKKKYPKTKIVYGGAYAIESADLIDEIDYVVVGLADKSAVDLADHLSKGTPLKWRPSMAHRWKILDYDKLGQSFEFPTSLTRFEQSDHMLDGEVIPLETSRGCMFKCKFCGYPLLGRKKTDPAYHRSEECLTEELRHNWENYKINKYIVVDDTFNETVGKLESVLRARDRAKVDLQFSCFLRIDLLNRFPEQIPLLKDMGLKAPFFGIESFNDASSSIIGKGLPSDKVKELLGNMKVWFGQDFNIHIGLIAGLPYETHETLHRGMEWVMDKDCPVDSFRLTALSLSDRTYPSEFTLNAEKYGYKGTRDNWYNDVWTQEEVRKIAEDYHKIAFDTGRQRLGSAELFAMLTYGHDFSELRKLPQKEIPWQSFKEELDQRYNKYVELLFNYEGIKI